MLLSTKNPPDAVSQTLLQGWFGDSWRIKEEINLDSDDLRLNLNSAFSQLGTIDQNVNSEPLFSQLQNGQGPICSIGLMWRWVRNVHMTRAPSEH